MPQEPQTESPERISSPDPAMPNSKDKAHTWRDETHDHRHSLRSRARRIAYAVHATLSCFATDFIDPLKQAFDRTQDDRAARGEERISLWKLISSKDRWKTIPSKYKEFFTWKHFRDSSLAEVSGDLAGGAIFIGISEFCSKPLETFTRGVGHLCKPLVNYLARKTTDEWARKEGVEKDSEAYKKQFRHWREFQAQALSYDGIISFFSTVSNIAIMKKLQPGTPTWAITKSKLAGVAATQVLLLGSRWLFPQAVRRYEDAFDKKIVEPVLKKLDKMTRGRSEDDVMLPADKEKKHSQDGHKRDKHEERHSRRHERGDQESHRRRVGTKHERRERNERDLQNTAMQGASY
jgi:hypothetical protein